MLCGITPFEALENIELVVWQNGHCARLAFKVVENTGVACVENIGIACAENIGIACGKAIGRCIGEKAGGCGHEDTERGSPFSKTSLAVPGSLSSTVVPRNSLLS